MSQCSINGCGGKHYALGMCRVHWVRNRRHGDPSVDLRTTHGNSRRSGKSAEYVAWHAMKSRCAATEGPDFESYGARGISVCDRWGTFDQFLEDMGPRPSPEHSLGRKNNDLGYFPDNCRWETPEQQQQNTKTSMTWSIQGVVYGSCREAARALGVDNKTIRRWVKIGKEGCCAVQRY
jgi:hypothetical protein